MPPRTTIVSHHTIRIPIPTDRADEEFGEGIVEFFIAKANRERQAQGLSGLCVAALASLVLPGTIHVEALLPFQKGVSFDQ
jgi:hypothetical protein